MNEQRLRELLASAPVPDEVGMLRRNWRIVRAAYEREERPSARERYARPLIAFAAAVALVAAAFSPPGQALGAWVREEVRERVVGWKPASAALVSLPAPGRLLVVSEEGAWVMRADGSKRLLGAYEDASWSPRGLFVVVARGRQLAAVEPDGDVRWSLSRARPITRPRWSASGFRIAYLSGRSLRVVAGDGSPDRLLARRVAPAAPAWRPGDAHVLAFAGRGGRVRAVDVDRRRLLWQARAPARPTRLEWSADGARLLVVTARSLRVYRRGGHGAEIAAAPAGRRFASAAFRPASRDVAYTVVERGGRESTVVVMTRDGPRRLFAGPGVVRDATWSPDGRWLLVAWRDADQWLFIPPRAGRKIVAASNIARQFDPGRPGRPEFPDVTGWCCPR